MLDTLIKMSSNNSDDYWIYLQWSIEMTAMTPVDDDGNRESEDEHTNKGAEPPNQLNIHDDHGADQSW